jgi:hypothetical protein
MTDFPASCDVRITTSPNGGATWAVLVAAPPLKAEIATFLRPGGLAALLTHDEGVCWPDRTGVAMAVAMLNQGGAVAFEFQCLADALRCETRLRRELARGGA